MLLRIIIILRPERKRNLYDFIFQGLLNQNETFVKWENASKQAYSYALAVAVGMGGVLCIVNGMLLLCICQRSSRRNCSKNRGNYESGATHDSTIHTTTNRYKQYEYRMSTIDFFSRKL